MKTAMKTLTVLAAVILMSSFTDKNALEFIGTYGVSASNPAQIKLVINADHTFYYQDFSNPNNKITDEGKWTLRGNKVVLEKDNSELQFHNVWTFAEDGQVAKSRKGLSFYRLCKIGN